MAEKTKAANNAAASDVDIGIITEIFKIDSVPTLVIDEEIRKGFVTKDDLIELI